MTDQKRKIIQVRNLSKFFGGVRALSNVSFDVFEEEVLGLIGPNGSGKTTLANIITGFVKPSLGDVLFKDIKISGLPPYKIADLGIARTFQIPRPFLSQKSFKNLIVPLGPGGLLQAEKEIETQWQLICWKRLDLKGMLMCHIN
jgi:ABC-type branched-subunit amino acid transport system ATPase component